MVCRGWVGRCMGRSPCVRLVTLIVAVKCSAVGRAAAGTVAAVVEESEERLLRMARRVVFGLVGMGKQIDCLVCRTYSISRLLGRRTIPPAIRSVIEGPVLVEETAELLGFVEGTAVAVAAAAETEIEEM